MQLPGSRNPALRTAKDGAGLAALLPLLAAAVAAVAGQGVVVVLGLGDLLRLPAGGTGGRRAEAPEEQRIHDDAGPFGLTHEGSPRRDGFSPINLYGTPRYDASETRLA